MKHVLFVCSQNRLRSPTAEQAFAGLPGVEVASAGLAPTAECQVSPELLEWADTIFVMEQVHRRKLKEKFGRYLKDQRIVCLDIPDEYEFMDPELVRLLQERVGRQLG